MQVEENIIGKNKLFVEHLLPDSLEDSVGNDNDIFEYPIVFIHGAFSGHYIWQRLSTFFAEKGFECYSISLRGHNSSGGELEKTGLDDYVSDIRTVIEELRIDKPILIGHSMGGLLSLMYAKKFLGEVKSVIGLDPAPTKESWSIPIDDELIDKFDAVVNPSDLGAPKSFQEAVDVMVDIPPEYIVEIDHRSGSESGKVWRELLKGVSIPDDSFGNLPILLLGVEYDHALPYSIPSEKVQNMAEIYNADFLAVASTTHVGIVIGRNYKDVGNGIFDWLFHSVGKPKDES